MKSEAEIRKVRDDLRKVIKIPLDCTCLSCSARDLNIRRDELILSWVLGENFDIDRNVESLSAYAAKHA